MKLFNTQKTAALATALMLCGLNAAAEDSIATYPGRAARWVGQTANSTWTGLFGSEDRSRTREALRDVRDQREAGVTGTDDVPALITIMNEPMPNATQVADVIRPRTPVSRLFVRYLTEPNIDVVLTDATLLVDELFQGDAAAKLLLTKSNTFKLAENFVYDVPMRARVSYLDGLIRQRLAADSRGTLLAGDTIILAAATGVALASGLHYGPTELSAAIRDVNWTGLARDARVATARQATTITEAGRTAVNESVAGGRTIASTVAATPGVLATRSSRFFLSPAHRRNVQYEVTQLLEAVAAREPGLVTDQVRTSLKLAPIPVLRTTGENAVRTRVPNLVVAVEDVTIAGGPPQSRLAFTKYVENSKRPAKHFVSEAMDPATAERLQTSLGLEQDVATAFNANGSPRAVSAELDEVLRPADPAAARVDRAIDAVETQVEGAAAKITEVAGDVKQNVTDAVETAQDKITEVAGTAKDQVAGAAAAAKDEGKAVVAKAANKTADAAEATADKARTVAANLDETSPPSRRRVRRSTTPTTKTSAAGLGSDTVASGIVDDAGVPPKGFAKVTETVRDYAESAVESISNATGTAGQTIKATAAHTGERIERIAGHASSKAQSAAAGARAGTTKVSEAMSARVNKTRAALKAEFNDFDRTAAFRDGTLVAAPGLIGWNVGYAYGFDDGQDQAAFGLEDQIPSELLQPVPLEGARQNVK